MLISQLCLFLTGQNKINFTKYSKNNYYTLIYDTIRMIIFRKGNDNMKEKVLLKTNLFICIIIILGFFITSIISYHSNKQIFQKDIEEVSNLTSEGIYHNIDTIFSKPINVSMTMANDVLLKDFLGEEALKKDDDSYIKQMRDYLNAYRIKYGYDSVFLVSKETSRYYYYNGLDRILTKDNPENEWYYDFLNSKAEYGIKIDNDEVANANNDITVFINCAIKGENKETIGVVGVGFRVKNLQNLLAKYETEYGIDTYLINAQGTIEISSTDTAYKEKNIFQNDVFQQLKKDILNKDSNMQDFWYHSGKRRGYLVSRYIDNLEWYLLIDHDTSQLQENLNGQIIGGFLVIIAVITCVLVIITNIIKKYNHTIVRMTQKHEKEHRDIFQKATEQMFQNIIELDITHNCFGNIETEEFFEDLCVPKGTPYDEALKTVAREQIKEEYQEGYIKTFSPENVLDAYKNGIESLTYDFMISDDGIRYYWMRITARIFTWEEDNSVRMFSYRQNIDAQKTQEKKLLANLERDHLSSLYNKKTTQDKIIQMLHQHPEQLFAFFILDIDAFKLVNDRFGHAVGDHVIADFAHILKNQFNEQDIVGRIGGDEFVAFIPVHNYEQVERKGAQLVKVLHHNYLEKDVVCPISTSIGVAIAPDAGTDFEQLYKNADRALYQTKKNGKNGFTIYQKENS